jgi:hypothetical protein
VGVIPEPRTPIDPPPPSSRPANTEPTIALCTAVHLDPELREEIFQFFAKDPCRAWGPSPFLNLVAVIRHARLARRTELLRDASLTAVLVGTLALVVGRIAHRDAFREVGLLLSALVVLVFGVVVLRKLGRPWRRMFRAVRGLSRNRIGLVLTVVVVLGLLSAAARAFTVRSAILGDLGVLILGVVVALGIVIWDEYVTTGRALRAYRGKVPLGTTAPARREDPLEERLAALHEPNLIVYNNRRRTSDTFVGSGMLLGEWLITVDTHRGRPDGKGDRHPPSFVDLKELYTYLRLEAEFGQIPDLEIDYRVYVDGRAIRDVENLMTGVLGPPRLTRLEYHEVEPTLVSPATRNRAYLCLRIPSWNGVLTVDTLIRAELVGSLLHFHIKVLMLPGIKLPRPAVMQRLTRSRSRQLSQPPKRAVANFLPRLLGAPGRVVHALLIPLRTRQLRSDQRGEARDSLYFEYGAIESLHEHYAVDVPMHSNQVDDLMRHFFVMQTHLTRNLEHFLDEKNVDTAGLRDAVDSVLSHQHNAIDLLLSRKITFTPRDAAAATAK